MQEQRDWWAVGGERGRALLVEINCPNSVQRSKCPVSSHPPPTPGVLTGGGAASALEPGPGCHRGQSTSSQASCKMEVVSYKDAPSHCEG